jgi:hypothetical protein
MKPSTNVPLTKAQRQSLAYAAKYYVNLWPNERRIPALRNAVKRLKKAENSPMDA